MENRRKHSDELRERAESVLTEQALENITHLSPEELRRTVSDLRVHLLELEMHNEELRQTQSALDASSKHSFDFYNLAPVGYCTISAAGLILEANLTAVSLLGLARNVLVNQPITHFIHQEDQEIYLLFRKKLLERKAPPNCDLRVVRKDGTVVWVQLNAVAAKDADGSPVCQLVLNDITERKQVEIDLHQSEMRFNQLAQQSGTVVWEVDAQGLYTYASPVAEAVWGYRPEELVGRLHFYDLHPEDGREAFKTATLAVFTRKDPFKDFENAIQTKEDAVKRMLTNALPLLDSDGNLLGYRGADLDITVRKQNEHFLRKLIDVLPGMVGYWDQDLRCGFANRGYLEWFGKSPEQMKGIHIRDLMGDELFNKNKPFITAALRGDDQHFERTLTKADGSSGYTWANYIPDSDGARVDGFFVLVTDVTELKQAEANLRTTLQEQATILDTANVGIVMVADRKQLWVNQKVSDLFQYSRAAMEGHTTRKLYPTQEAYEQLDRDSYPILALGQIYKTEQQMVRADGSTIWVSINGKAVEPQNLSQGIVWTFEDITERKQAEQEIKRQAVVISSLLDAIPDLIFFKDLNGVYVGCNPSLAEVVGCARDEIIGKTDHDFFAKEIADFFREQDHRMLEAGKPRRNEEWITYPDGRKVLFETLKKPFWGPDGTLLGLLGISHDITERKQSEQAQEKSNERLRLILNSTAEGIYGIDTTGSCTFCNQATLKLLGYEREEELLGRNMHTLCHHTLPDGSPFPEHNCRIFKSFQLGEGTYGNDDIFWCKDGSSFPVEYWSFPKYKGGEIDGAVVTFFDITERKLFEKELITAKEAAVAASHSKSEFLANMSHEIRTPMNGVIGMTGLLLDTELSKEQRHYAETVRASGESLLGLINDILDFSKIEAGKLDLEILDFDLSGLLDDFAAAHALRAQEKGLELTCAADLEVPELLRGDPGRLRQILNNLTSNAVKFTHQGEVSIRVSLMEQSETALMLRFSVRDTGIGIPADKIAQLFDKFSQVDASTTRKYGGTGLGLAISKQLAQLMEGEVGLESEEGSGSEFWFTARFGKQAKVTQTAPAPPVDLRGVRTLIVDDNATNRTILATRLASWGMRPTETEDGPGALRMLYQALDENDSFRIAVIDLHKAGMNREVLGRAIKAEPRLSALKMVMLTSMGERGDARRFAELGFGAYVTKPIRHQELAAVLSLTLSDRDGDGLTQPPIVTRHLARETLKNRYIHRKDRILLAEDNITNQEVALGVLQGLGLRADAVADGAEAVFALETIPYDLVLMDCQMPAMDGYQATAQIRDPQSRCLNHAIPIIAMTANAMQGDREKCLQAGMNDYLTKPIVPQALVEALDKWLLPDATAPTQEYHQAAPRSVAVDSGKATIVPVFDMAGLMERLMDNEILAYKILTGYLNDLPRKVIALQGYLAAGDVENAGRMAHTIKGAAANIGGEPLRRAALAMEHAGKAGDIDAAQGYMPELEVHTARLKAAIEQHLETVAGEAGMLHWQECYAIGIPHIDEQHQQLFALLNRFYTEVLGSASSAVAAAPVAEMVDLSFYFTELARYALFHLADEERWMQENAYPGFAMHQKQHEKFARQVAELTSGYHAGEKYIFLYTASFIHSWIQKHILQTDAEFGRFLAARSQGKG